MATVASIKPTGYLQDETKKRSGFLAQAIGTPMSQPRQMDVVGVPGKSGQYGGINPQTKPIVGGEKTGSMARDPAPSAASPGADIQTGAATPAAGVPGSEAPAESQPVTAPASGDGFLARAQPAGASAYLNPTTDTVEGRLTTMLGQNSDYMKRAGTKAAQVMNARGLANSSLAAGAAHAAAIDAALPVAQQDASTYAGFGERNQQLAHQQGLNADQYAQERATKQWEQENLAYSQFIKGVSDINMQDMSAEAKDQAVKNLWDQYLAGRPISSSLADVQIIDGKVVRSGASSGTQSGGGGASSDPVVAGEQGGGQIGGAGAPNPQDYLSYNSIADMPAAMRDQYAERYGNIEPPQVKGIQSVIDYANDKFKDYIKDKGHASSTGALFKNADYVREYNKFILAEMKKLGLPEDLKMVNTVAGFNPGKAEQQRGSDGESFPAPNPLNMANRT